MLELKMLSWLLALVLRYQDRGKRKFLYVVIATRVLLTSYFNHNQCASTKVYPGFTNSLSETELICYHIENEVSLFLSFLVSSE